jgi:hypothetical protein
MAFSGSRAGCFYRKERKERKEKRRKRVNLWYYNATWRGGSPQPPRDTRFRPENTRRVRRPAAQ